VFVPAKTPKPIVARLNAEINRIMALPDVKERLSKDGVDPAGSTPEQLNTIVQNEKKMWSKVIKQANIKIQ
jgi:tripartite-type tricarboxylate transporter receptor subunit TctC